MNWSSFKYLTRQGLHSMVANRLMTLASVGVLTACLIITGIAGLFSANVSSMVDYMGEQNQSVVYPAEGLSAEQAAAVDTAIRSISGISEVTYVSREEVLERYKVYMDEYADLWNDFEGDENPFRPNYQVVVSDPENLEAIINQLRSIEGVDDVKALLDMSSMFVTVQRAVNFCGWALVVMLGAVSIVVIHNTIRLTVFARRREINIMKYVGATNGFIRMPFFIEGMASGVLAGLLAGGIVLGGYAAILHFVGELPGVWQQIVEASVLPLSRVWYVVLGGFCLFGILIGSIGSAMSVRKYLKV